MSWQCTKEFEYVVQSNIQEQQRICFGSSMERSILPKSGPNITPFMRRLAGQDFPNVGPASHVDGRGAFYDLTHRIYSKYGLGARAPRFPVKRSDHQPPPPELPPIEPCKQNSAPFNSTSKRKSFIKTNNYPAPCDYDAKYKRRTIKFQYSFGGKKVLECPVETKCVPYNLDQCEVCGCSCSAQGDYWQYENRIFLCRKHYDRLFNHCIAKYKGIALYQFKPIRDCFYAHEHNSCKAAVKIMSKQEIKHKMRTEAYFDLYFPLRRFCAI